MVSVLVSIGGYIVSMVMGSSFRVVSVGSET
jgi:hypothetical protein